MSITLPFPANSVETGRGDISPITRISGEAGYSDFCIIRRIWVIVYTDGMAVKKRKTTKPVGRPRMDGYLEKQEKIVELVGSGDYTTTSILKTVGVSFDTLADWQISFPEFGEHYKKAKENARKNLGELAESALKKKVCGYEFEEVIKKKGTGPKGPIDVEEIHKKHIPPSDTAIIFALKNLNPEHYKDKVELDSKQEIGPESIAELKSEISKLMKELGDDIKI